MSSIAPQPWANHDMRVPRHFGKVFEERGAPEPMRAGGHDGVRAAAGMTLIELVVAMAVLSILAAGILPLSQTAYRRSKEHELRQNLRTIREALDKYKELVDEGKLPSVAGQSGYPKTLSLLVEGVMLPGPIPTRLKLLRRIPPDPMTEDGQWGLRSYADEHDSTIWGGQDVYDVYSQSDRLALDGTAYRQW